MQPSKSLSSNGFCYQHPLLKYPDCADGSQNQTGQPNLDKRLRQYSAYELNRKKLPKNSQINKTSLQSQRSSLQLSQSKNQIPPRDHHHHTQQDPFLSILVSPKVEKILKFSLDLISSPSPSVKIQIIGGKVCLRSKGKTLLDVADKLCKTESLLTLPSNVLPYFLK